MEPSDAVVSYQWYADGEEIEDATDDELLITPDMVGSKISVAVMDADGNSDLSDETEEVGVYEALEILSAEQTGANTVKVTFSAPATSLDTLTVTKGSAEKVIASQAFDDTTFKTKTLTMKDNFTNGTYTVTLTPADEDVDPSSVEFVAEAATKAAYIDVKGDKFLMKNTEFEEGYCFIEGYNEFDEPINLTGLQVNVAPSDSVSFDSSTGKVTAKFKDHGYAIVPIVTVFASYTAADGNILTCQKTLDVESIGYPSEIEFGDVKIDGEVDDTVTINDLATNKYYVELNVVKDQDGNDLSAEDLNDLEEDDLLTVIPQSGSPIFFGTNENPFSTVDGKVVVYLTPADAGKQMPGLGQLMITGAGGTFTKEVEIFDNPFIQTLTVDMPDLYEGEWSDEIALSAVDQYGEEINLWDFAPNLNGKKNGEIEFTDRNNLTGIRTKISGENQGTWEVKKDTVAKTFKVRYMPHGAEKQVATFTIVTAGLNNRVITRNIGAHGEGAQINAQDGAYALVEGKTETQNLNKLVSFKDANGKVMVRTDCYDTYPKFLAANALGATSSEIKDKDITDWYWTVTENKVPETATTTEVTDAIGKYDADGEITIGANTATTLGANADNATPSYYVTLLGKANGQYKVLDSKAFRFTYTPAAGQDAAKYIVSPVSGTMYASKNGYTTKDVEVLAVNDSGETWKPRQDLITLKPNAPFKATGNTVSGNVGKDLGEGTVDVKVYYKGVAIDTIGIAYSDDDPVPTSTEVKLATKTRMGKNWDAATTLTSFDTPTDDVTAVKFENGTLTIENLNGFKDTLTACIKDQYGQVMDSSIIKLNGENLVTKTYTAANLPIANFVVTNGTQKIDLELENENAITTNKAVYPAATPQYEVATEDQYKTLFDNYKDEKAEVTLTDSITAAANFEVPENWIVKVPAGKVLDTQTNAKTLTVTGTLNVAGTLLTGLPDGGTATTPNGKVTVNGTVNLSGKWSHKTDVLDGSGTIKGAGHMTIGGAAATETYHGSVTLEGDTLEINADVTFSAAVKLGGHIIIDAGTSKALKLTGAAEVGGRIEVLSDGVNPGTLDLGNTSTLQKDTIIDLSKGGTINTGTGAKLAAGAEVTIITASGTETSYVDTTDNESATIKTNADGTNNGSTGVKPTTEVEASMDALNTVATAYGTSITNLTDLWTGVSIAAPVKTTTEKGEIVYTYEVSGTLKYIADANADGVSVKPLGFGGSADRHWFFGVNHTALDTTTMKYAKVSGGANKYSTSEDAMTAASTGSSVETVNGEKTDKDTWICGAKNDGEQYMALYYEFKDGAKVFHVYHIPASCFEAAPSSSTGA